MSNLPLIIGDFASLAEIFHFAPAGTAIATAAFSTATTTDVHPSHKGWRGLEKR
jgi:hypothetical protein